MKMRHTNLKINPSFIFSRNVQPQKTISRLNCVIHLKENYFHVES